MAVAAAAAAVIALVFAGLGSSHVAQSEETSLVPAPKRVYVIVVDGLMARDVTPLLMPNLAALKAQSTWYKEARAVFVSETLPNHVAMMTGVTAAKNGIPGNRFAAEGRGINGGDKAVDPTLLRADTLVTRLEGACGPGVSTATVLSKAYLYWLFAGEQGADPDRQLEADFHWQPDPLIPVSDHAPDAATMSNFVPWARREPTPQFAFVNLGDVDRAGHADDGGNIILNGKAPGDEDALRANQFQRTAMLDTDKLLGDFVSELKANGWWDESVIALLSDHGMNWARHDQEHWLDTEQTLSGTPRLDGRGNYVYGASGDYNLVNNGAADMVYILEQDPDERKNIVKAVRNMPGVERVLVDPEDFSAEGAAPQHPRSAYGLEDGRAADLIALAKPGYSFNLHLKPDTNPVPGVHGHAATQHSVLMVTGGHPSLAQAREVDGVDVWPILDGRAPLPPDGGPGTMSVAPTVAALTGLGDIGGQGYDANPLTEAFATGALGGTAPFCAGIDPPRTNSSGGGSPTGSGGSGSGGEEGVTDDRPGLGGPAVEGSAATSLATSAKTVRYRRPFVLSGRVTASGGCPRPEWVEVRRRVAGGREYEALAELPVSRGGSWRMEISASSNADYLAVPDATNCAIAPSPVVPVLVAAEVVLKRVRACARGGSIEGAVRPGQPGTQVLLQRRVRSRWATVARGRLDGGSAFRLTPKRCQSGLHRVLWPRQGTTNAGGERRFRR